MTDGRTPGQKAIHDKYSDAELYRLEEVFEHIRADTKQNSELAMPDLFAVALWSYGRNTRNSLTMFKVDPDVVVDEIMYCLDRFIDIIEHYVQDYPDADSKCFLRELQTARVTPGMRLCVLNQLVTVMARAEQLLACLSASRP